MEPDTVWAGAKGGTFHSLAWRNYRLFFFGQLISLTGTWMQHVAQAWLVYRLSGSSLMLGLVAFLSNLPILVFGLFGGVLADRFPKRNLLIAAHGIAIVQAAVLAWLTLTDQVQIEHLLVLAVVLGLVNALEMPARQSFVVELVPRPALPNAIALNSGLFSVARFAGPALAGGLVAWIGEGWVFALNSVSYLAVIAALMAMRPTRPGLGDGSRPAGGLPEGLRYAWRERRVRATLGMVLTVSLFGIPYAVLMPVFAREVFGSGAQLLGLLLGAAGAGAFVAAMRLARRRPEGGFEGIITWAGIGGGLSLLLFSRIEVVWLALLVLPAVGYAFTTLIASGNTFIQLLVPDGLRGRVMALFSVTFIGMTPIGNLLAGGLGQWLGVATTVAIYGAICVMAAVTFRVARRGADL